VRRHRLQEGDVVKLGMHEIVYYRAEPAGSATMILPRGGGEEDEEDEEDAELEDGREA